MRLENPAITPEDLLAHSGWLQRLAARLVDAAGADDLVQETWEAALRSPPARDRPLRPWLAEVLRNLVRNRARGAARWAARVPEVAVSHDVPLPTADELLTYHEAQRLVAELVAQLEEPYRSTVLLCYAQGLPPSEVAQRQSIPAGTVRWRLKRGIDDLRARLDARYGNDRAAWQKVLAPLAVGATKVVATTVSVLGVRLGAMKLVAAMAVLATFGWWMLPGTASRRDALEGADPTAMAARGATTVARAVPRLAAPPATGAPQPGPAPGPEPLRPGAAAAAAPATDKGGAPGNGPPPEAIAAAMAVGNAPVKGDPKAPVTIVMFTEFQCPFCARVQPVLAQLLAAYPTQVRLVFKNLPLEFHEHAALAAEAGMAAQEQGKFWQMHDLLFQNQTALDPVALTRHAQTAGLDVERFRKALDEQRFRKVVEEDLRVAKAANITGTPAFLINGQMFSGAQPLEAFKQMVDTEYARAKGLPLPARPANRGQAPPVSAETFRRAMVAGNAPTRGPATAPVTMVLFGDFECSGCARLPATLTQVMEAYPNDVRMVFRNLPFDVHPHAFAAAEAALAANEQGKFWEMHDRLFANPQALDAKGLEDHARAVGLDMERFQKAMADHKFRSAVEDDKKMAVEIGFAGVPSFLINGRSSIGAMPSDYFKSVIDREIARAKGLPVVDPPPSGQRPSGPRPRMDLRSSEWPPPRLALPDEALGEAVKVPFVTGRSPFVGGTRAPVTIIYFNDYDCMGCGRGKTIVDGLRSVYRDNVRIIAKPVVSRMRGANGALVAEAVWAAEAQGRFWEMYDKIFSQDTNRDRPTLERYAKELGMDVDDFGAALEDHRFRDRVAEDAKEYDEAGLREMPAFVVNGRRADGVAALVQLVDTALKKAGKVPPALPPPPPREVTGPYGPMASTLPPNQLFYSEARNESWAAALEQQLTPILTSDLRTVDPTTAGVKVECRTSVCRLAWRPGKSAAGVRVFVRSVYMPARQATTATEDQAYFQWRAGAPGSSAEEVVASFKSRRIGVLYALRTGRKQVEGLSATALPKE